MSLSDSLLPALMDTTFNFSDYLHYNNIASTDDIFANYVSSLYTLGETSTIVLICIYVPVFLVAFIGNAMLLVIVLPHRALWGVTSSFLVNLALADILVAVVCIPMTVAEKVYPLWVYGDVMCKAVTFLQGVSVTASTFTLAVMSMDRCLAIRHPMKCRSIRTSGHVKTLLILIWIFSAIVISPLLFLRKTASHEILPSKFITYCVESWPSRQTRRIYDVVLLIVLYAIPGTIVIVSYSLMGRRLWTTDKTLEHSRRQNSIYVKNKPIDSIMAGRRNLARMLIVMAALFAACWLPYSIITTYAGFAASDDTASVLNVISFSLVLGHFNSAVNPILYSFMNKTFRRYMKKLLRCNGKRRRSAQNEKGYLLAKLSWKTRSVKSTFVSSLRGRSNSHSTNPSSERSSPMHGQILRRSLTGYGTMANGSASRECPEKNKSRWDKLKRENKARTFAENMFHNFEERLNIPSTIGEELSESMKNSPSSPHELSQLSSALRSEMTKSLSCDLQVDTTNCEIHENTCNSSNHSIICDHAVYRRDNDDCICDKQIRCIEDTFSCCDETHNGERKASRYNTTSSMPLEHLNDCSSLENSKRPVSYQESWCALLQTEDDNNACGEEKYKTNIDPDRFRRTALHIGKTDSPYINTKLASFHGSQSAHSLVNPLFSEFRENVKNDIHTKPLLSCNEKGTKTSISCNNLKINCSGNAVVSVVPKELKTNACSSHSKQCQETLCVNMRISEIDEELGSNIYVNPEHPQDSENLKINVLVNPVHLGTLEKGDSQTAAVKANTPGPL